MSSSRVLIEFQYSRVRPPASERLMRRWLTKALTASITAWPVVARMNMLTVRFVGTREAQEINQRFRRKNYATNVLTFSYSQNPLTADLILCTTVIRREASCQGKPFLNHLAHLLVHGALHARGMNHEKPKQAAIMEGLEVELLADLGIANPYE